MRPFEHPYVRPFVTFFYINLNISFINISSNLQEILMAMKTCLCKILASL